MHRYGLHDDQWDLIKDLLPSLFCYGSRKYVW